MRVVPAAAVAADRIYFNMVDKNPSQYQRQ